MIKIIWLPPENVLWTIYVDWAHQAAVIAGLGSSRHCCKIPSFRALQGAPCEALCRFAHLESESMQKGAKPQLFFEISIVTVSRSTGRVCGPNQHSVAEACRLMQLDLSSRPTLHWTSQWVCSARDDREFYIFAQVANTSDAKTAYFKSSEAQASH